MGERIFSSNLYRYGYQGSEKDNDVKGEANSYTTFYRQLDPRLGRWLSLDPKVSQLPWQSPYCSMDNNPVWFNDVLGDKVKVGKKKEEKEKVKVPEPKRELRLKEGLNKNEIDITDATNYEQVTTNQDEIDKANAENEKIERYNKKIRAHNEKIDQKIALFKCAGYTFDYNNETGVLENARLVSSTPLEPNSVEDILFKTINSDKTYKMKINGLTVKQEYDGQKFPSAPDAIRFVGKNSIRVSSYALSNPGPGLQKMVAADAAEFLGMGDAKDQAFRLFLNGADEGYDQRRMNIGNYGVQFLYWKEFNTKKGHPQQRKFVLATR